MSCIIQRKVTLIIAFLFISTYVYGQDTKELTLLNAVGNIDSIYSSCYGNPLLARRRLLEYTNNMPKSIRPRLLYRHYLEAVEESINHEDIDGIIRNGEIYIYIGAEKDLLWVINVVAKVHAQLGHESEVNIIMGFFEDYSRKNGNEYDKEVETLRKEVRELLYPPKVEDVIKGAWVMLDTRKKEDNPLIIRINDVTKENGAWLIPPNYALEIHKHKGVIEPLYIEQINISQGISFNGQEHYMGMQFGSMIIKDRSWLGVVSLVGTELTREGRAILVAKNRTPQDPDKLPNFKDIARGAGQEIAVNLIANGIDKLLTDMTYSTNTQEVYQFVLRPTINDVLFGEMSHEAVVVDNDGNKYVSDNTQDKSIGFVRWEDSDSVIFISANGNPITLNPIDVKSPLLRDYYRIQKESSYWNPQYSIPSILFTALGGFLVYSGIKEISNNDNVLLGAGLSIGGIGVVIGAIEIPIKKSEKKKAERYQELNKRSYTKLYRKGVRLQNQ